MVRYYRVWEIKSRQIGQIISTKLPYYPPRMIDQFYQIKGSCVWFILRQVAFSLPPPPEFFFLNANFIYYDSFCYVFLINVNWM